MDKSAKEGDEVVDRRLTLEKTALIIYCCRQGNERRFFTSEKEARAYARRRYDFEDEGIPFVYGVHVHTAQHICDELNWRPKHEP